MTPQQFVAKWSKIQLKEMTTAHSHFLDVCQLANHLAPLDADPKGQFFTFEAVSDKIGGKKGRADVWYKGRFIWEYKGPNHDLDKAYEQLLLYRESLGNPPLLITSDTQRIIIHTNFNNTVKEVHEITFERLLKGDGLSLLKRVFLDPNSFKPTTTQAAVTQATADTFVAVANTLQKWQPDADPERLAHFIIRLLFCLFAEDMGLLPDNVFSTLINYQGRKHFSQFTGSLRELFNKMREGGFFGATPIPYFDGGLFDDDFVPDLPSDIIDRLSKAAVQDWSAIDPTIFGTLFERIIDPQKRAQLGAHYTDKSDIMLIVEPVLMQPLRDKWLRLKFQVQGLLQQGQREEAASRLSLFAAELAALRVLDPAGGSGNFLYIALRQLLALQKEVIVFAAEQGLPAIPLSVSPHQLYGIEVNPYAHELAQITVWIGYIQWRMENGFPEIAEPILQPLPNIERKDAILAYDENGKPIEPAWPEVDVIIGNPPFLGGNKIRQELGDKTVDSLFKLYNGRIPAFADLVCYWFEKARAQIANGQSQRAGLIATNSIRGGVNREVLKRIKESGDIFMAWSDNPWVLDGAAVRVSMVGFDNGSQSQRVLDGEFTTDINADLTGSVDLTQAKQLPENAKICFIGTKKAGAFDIDESFAKKLLQATNISGRKNTDVVLPWLNGQAIVKRMPQQWIIYFGEMSEAESALYEKPFEYVKREIYPIRQENNEERARRLWWQHRRPATEMHEATKKLRRFIATPRVAKFRLYDWVMPETLPDDGTYMFAREDDYFFGVLHSRPHEIWALRQGTSLEDRPRYTPTTTFETFPFPWPPGQEPDAADDAHVADSASVAAIAQAARALDSFRQSWLNPPAGDIGTIISASVITQRTLTNLYNALNIYRTTYKGKMHDRDQWHKSVKNIISLEKIADLDYIHGQLDTAVLAAYGWPLNLSDEQILERLLALNLQRAEK